MFLAVAIQSTRTGRQSVLMSALCIGFLSLLTADAEAQVRAQYTFDGGSPSSIDTDATTTASDITFGAFTGGPGGGSTGFSASSGTAFVRATATGAATADGDELADALLNDAYVSFTFDPLAASIDLAELQYDYRITDAASLDFTVSLLSDVGGFNDTSVLDTFTFNGGGNTPTQTQLVDLSAVTGFSSVTSPIEFRFYLHDGSNGNSRIHRLDNIILSSTGSAADVEWLTDADGSWNVGANWSTNPDVAGVGPQVDVNALFGGAITEARTVTLDTNAQLDGITFSNASSYTVVDDSSNPGVNAITLTGTATVSVTDADATINASIAGSDGLNKTGGGELFLGGANSYTGITNIQAGTLRVTNAASINDTVNVGTGTNFIFQGDPDSTGAGFDGTFTPDITGTGDVILSDSLTTETVTLAGPKSLGGLVNVNGGTLVISDGGALGASATTGTGGADRTQVTSAGDNEGQIQLSGGITVASETLDLNQRGTGSTTAHLSNLSGNNTWAGEINLDGGAGEYIIESQADLLTLSGNIIDSDDDAGEVVNLVVGGAGNGRIEGNFVDLDATLADGINDNDNIALTKRGTGTWTLAASSPFDSFNTYGGNTTVEEGTLVILPVALPFADSGEVRSPVLAVNSGATLDVSGFTTYSVQIGQSLQGAGTVDATGSAVRVTGASSVKPGDDGGVGTLAITGDLNVDDLLDTEPLAVPDRGLHFQLTDVTTAGSGVNDLITVSGNLDVNGQDGDVIVSIVPVGDGLASGDYTLIDYGTVSFQNSGAFTPQLIDADGNAFPVIRQGLTVVDDAVNGVIELQVSGAAGNLVWDGTVNNVWDVGDNNVGGGLGTANWDNSSVQDEFVTLDAVTFDDTASVFTVDVVENVLPSSSTFSNATNAYTLTGVGGIQGGSLAVNGAAGVTLDNDGNTFSSVSIASGATLTLGDGVGGTDTINVLVDIANEGSLVLNEESGGETLNGVISGSGSVTSQSSNLTLGGNNTYTGATIVNGQVTINNTDTGTPLGDVSTGTTVNAGGVLRGNAETGTVAEAVTLNGGELAAGGGTLSTLTWSGDITIGAAPGATIQLDGGTDTFSGGVRQTNGLTIDGAVSGSSGQDLQVGSGGGSTLVINGVVSHDGALNKVGAGTAELTAANTYTGDTNVNGGTLALVGSGSIASTNINVASDATFDVSGATSTFELASGQTLSVGPEFIASAGGSLVNAGAFDNEASAARGDVVGDVNLASGSTADGLGTYTGNVTAQSGSTFRVGQNGIATGSTGTTTSEDFEGFAPQVVLTGGVDNGALTGWTLTDVVGTNGGGAAVDTDVVIEISGADGSANNEIAEGPTSHSQLLAVTSTNYDFLLSNNSDVLGGSFALMPASTDVSGAVDIVTADVVFDGSGDTSDNFLDQRILVDYVDPQNYVALQLVRGQAGMQVDVEVVSGGTVQSVFGGFGGSDAGDYSAGLPEDAFITAEVVHDVNTGFLSFSLTDDGGTVLVEAFAFNDLLKTAGTGLVGFGSNNDAFAVDNISVTTQSAVNVGGIQIATIDGDFTLDAGSTLELDLLSIDTYDRLAVTGTADLNGTLDVNLSGGFAPVLGDQFQIFDLDFGLAVGTLAFALPDLSGSGLDWDTTGLLVDGILEVVTASANLVGDFNGDGMVDSGDYAFWRNNLGVGAELAGTGDGSGILDAADLAFWVGNFGATSPGAAGAAAVPEPTTLVLCGLSAIGLAVRRRR